ncbi:MAG TPA: hypothetical protein PKW08_11855 [Flavobacteriaceae bacterium]|nr:hypothetical protein [Flavobacteriaceae bacterium]MCB9212325.1 hypothetical protein [Alteromonas sp.]HPF12468.1 hypothetical protein [Flavobacteriaceae bacterium]HQU22273.1 hypothetical protein [Flavobacteriaceae bacterium]HQU65194.1 hypothetical protein [Flavobacteriaceae bacterium]
MKIFKKLGGLVLAMSIVSCASVAPTQNTEKELAGYILKNKKELMQQKVLHKNNKTVIAIP